MALLTPRSTASHRQPPVLLEEAELWLATLPPPRRPVPGSSEAPLLFSRASSAMLVILTSVALIAPVGPGRVGVAAGLQVTPGVAEEGEPPVERTAGPERIATAVAVSAEHRETATAAVLATAGDYPDALAAGALAGRLGAPVLLSGADALPEPVGGELQRLDVDTVYALGGPAALSDDVVDQVSALGVDVIRLAGTDRFDTARRVALEAGPTDEHEVVLALGQHPEPPQAWPDALAAGTLAATPQHVPTLLSDPDAVPPATLEALAELDTQRVLIAGGTAGISRAVEDELLAAGYATERLAGADRYETSVRLAELAYARFDSDQQAPTFASGATFPDALTAGALAASSRGPLILVPPDRLPDVTDTFLRDPRRSLAAGGARRRWGGSSATSSSMSSAPRSSVRHVRNRRNPSRRSSRPSRGRPAGTAPGFQGKRTGCGGRFDPQRADRRPQEAAVRYEGARHQHRQRRAGDGHDQRPRAVRRYARHRPLGTCGRRDRLPLARHDPRGRRGAGGLSRRRAAPTAAAASTLRPWRTAGTSRCSSRRTRCKRKLAKAQEEIAAREVTGSAGGGTVTAVATGAGVLTRVEIDPEAVVAEDVELLEDMVLAAVNEALRAAKELETASLGGLAQRPRAAARDALRRVGRAWPTRALSRT